MIRVLTLVPQLGSPSSLGQMNFFGAGVFARISFEQFSDKCFRHFIARTTLGPIDLIAKLSPSFKARLA